MWQNTATYDIGTTQWEDDIIKCEKKNKGTIKCDKSIITCDVNTAQCKDGTINVRKI